MVYTGSSPEVYELCYFYFETDKYVKMLCTCWGS